MARQDWKRIAKKATEKPETKKKEIYSGDIVKVNFKTWLKRRIKHFFSVTALHGYNHIAIDDTALWEKIFWGFIGFAAIIIAVLLLWLSWEWNSETPTVTVIESTHYGTYNIPFPAVTICNANKISTEAALAKANSMAKPANMSVEELAAKFRLIYHFESYGEAAEIEYHQLHEILRFNSLTVRQLAIDIAPSCTNMLQRCMWKGTQEKCETLFSTIKGSLGLCCSFNYRALPNSEFPSKNKENGDPRRISACGYQTGLSVLIQPQLSDYHTTYLGTSGIRVLVHDAYDYPDNNAETKLISPKLEAFLSLAPEASYGTPDIYNLPKSERNCVSPEEVKLTVFQKYSYINCLAECRSSVIFKICDCIPYSLPNNGSMPFCEMDQLTCVKNNKARYLRSLPGINRTEFKKDEYPCDCYPDCNLLLYPGEVSSGNFDRDNAYNSLGFFKDIIFDNQTLVHVFFKDLVSTYYRKDMYQNWLGVLGSFGGILGLFLGFSLITGFEFVYFFTLRLIFDFIAPKKIKPLR